MIERERDRVIYRVIEGKRDRETERDREGECERNRERGTWSQKRFYHILICEGIYHSLFYLFLLIFLLFTLFSLILLTSTLNFVHFFLVMPAFY